MSLIKSIWNYTCPRCREGDLFVKPFNIAKPLEMHERCSVCNQRFEPEPGYYFGAMYISYMWTGGVCLVLVGFCILVLGWSVEKSFALLIALTIPSFCFVMRISRSIYIHLDVKYKGDQYRKQAR